MRAAETLFATKGIDNTSVREVNALAAQRNTSAIRYHFGGMEGLLAALIEERMGVLDQARQEALVAMEAATPEDNRSLADYVGVLVLPLVLNAQKDETWRSWICILAQLVSIRGHDQRDLWEGRFDETTRNVFRKIRQLNPASPSALWQQRVSDFMLFTIGSIREHAERKDRDIAGPSLTDAAYRRNLVLTATRILKTD